MLPEVTPLMGLGERLFNRPLMMSSSHLNGLLSALAVGQMNRFVGVHDSQSKYNVTEDGIAIVPVHGSLWDRGAWLGDLDGWGLTTYEGLGEQFKRLTEDKDIKAVLVDEDSGGGEVAGLFDLIPIMDELKSVKPVVAVASSCAASAAYAIGCTADEFYVNRKGIAGSIGVVSMHMSVGKLLDNMGLKATLLHAGSHKVDGHPYEDLPDDVRAEFQASIDETREDFIAHVAKYRPLSEDQVRDTEAQVYSGQSAVDAGIADGVKSFEEVLAHMRSDVFKGRIAAKSGEKKMTNLLPGPVAGNAPTPAPVAGDAPAPVAEDYLRVAPSADDLRKEGAKAASDRFKAIMGCEEAKGQEAYARTIAIDTDVDAETAKTLLSGAKAQSGSASSQGINNALEREMVKNENSGGIEPDDSNERSDASFVDFVKAQVGDKK